MIRDRIKGLLKQQYEEDEDKPTREDGQWENVVEVHHNVSRRTVRMKVLYGGKKISIDLKGIIRVSASGICAESVVSEVSAGESFSRIKAMSGEVFFVEESIGGKVLLVERMG